jgi:hypothetical protein
MSLQKEVKMMSENRWRAYRRTRVYHRQIGLSINGVSFHEAWKHVKKLLNDKRFLTGTEVVIENKQRVSETILPLNELNQWLKKRNSSEG